MCQSFGTKRKSIAAYGGYAVQGCKDRCKYMASMERNAGVESDENGPQERGLGFLVCIRASKVLWAYS
ncbi:hypothetical protein K737_300139 [Holospora undulata HU1]|uniref:Uncharacterized protein n=1 Tax=Holospora undulata HU1 TaxID=1321371 RepID=A0A061JH19_9PROT|nr:hypothetical protein K737_300139 [Holospora undulata HU1]